MESTTTAVTIDRATTAAGLASLVLVRHAESAGNVARDAAEASGADRIDIDVRDMDVPLSPAGERQAQAVGRWLRERPRDLRPDVVLSSPYRRTLDTARIALEESGLAGVDHVVDERLREREFGVLDRLTRAGITRLYPDLAAERRFLGKVYHRPPGGESWMDVGLRVRSLLADLERDRPGARVVVVTHQVVVLMHRYVLEGLDEATLLAVDRAADVANGAVTEFTADPEALRPHRLRLVAFNAADHLSERGAPVTHEPEPPH